MNIIFTSIVISMMMSASISFAQDDGCRLSKISTKSDDKSDTDGGTRANASVTAKVTADDGFFIWGPSVKYTNNGSRSARESKASVIHHNLVDGEPVLHGLILKEATYTATCRDVGGLGDASCTATSFIVGTQFPVGCIEPITRDSLEEALKNIKAIE